MSWKSSGIAVPKQYDYKRLCYVGRWRAHLYGQLLSITRSPLADGLRDPVQRSFILAELKRFVFSDEYTPQRTARGESVLDFTGVKDADAFAETIEDLARAYGSRDSAEVHARQSTGVTDKDADLHYEDKGSGDDNNVDQTNPETTSPG
jgi:hypothetical protein